MLRQAVRTAVRFLKADDGPTAAEYAFSLGLIIVVCLGAATVLGNKAGGPPTPAGTAVPAGS